MRPFLLALFFHLTLNLLFFFRGWDALKGKKPLQWLLASVFGLELILYAGGMIFGQFIPHEFIHFSRLLGTSWMLFLFYASGIMLLIDFAVLIVKRRFPTPAKYLALPQRIKIITYFLSIGIAVVILIFGSYKFRHPVVNQVDISINKPAKNIHSVRIAMIGDVHLGYLINRSYAKKYVDLIMAQRPDLILFVGDIADSKIEPLTRERMDEELRRLHAPLGVYSCPGNHEYRFEAEQKFKWINDAGITMLRDSAVLIDSTFYVVGREDFVNPERLSLKDLLKKQRVDMSKPVIVLNHTPNDLDEEVNAGADIALYGHTHHGQAFPGNIATETVFEVAHGYKKKHNTNVYVTSGLGLAGPQFRVGTESEIVMLNVTFER